MTMASRMIVLFVCMLMFYSA